MDKPPYTMDDLLQLMRTLRDPDRGCPWDRQQTLQSLTPYTIEETYEVVDCIERHDGQGLKNELGDLLFQVVFYAQIAAEQGQFDFQSVISEICDKLIRRHPHVFIDQTDKDLKAINSYWEAEKSRERQEKNAQATSVLDDIPANLPALMRAAKIQRRCASVGFDWTELPPVVDKVAEELDEVKAELVKKPRQEQHLEEELGDLLFACVNLVRHCGFEPEKVLRKGNQKFERRFRHVEAEASLAGKSVADCSLPELELIWQKIKQFEQN